MMTQTAHRESLVMAFSDVFLVLAIVFMAMVLIVPFIRKPVPRSAPAGGDGH
jgi:DHA2 family multidrug resistance protein